MFLNFPLKTSTSHVQVFGRCADIQTAILFKKELQYNADPHPLHTYHYKKGNIHEHLFCAFINIFNGGIGNKVHLGIKVSYTKHFINAFVFVSY